MPPSFRRARRGSAFLLTVAALLVAAPTLPVNAAPASAETRQRGLVIEAGMGRVVALAGTAANVFVADPKVAEVRPASPSALFVFGLAPGRTTVAALDAAGRPLAQYAVTVRPSSYVADSAAAAVVGSAPDAQATIRPTLDGISVSGTAPSPVAAVRALAAAHDEAPPGAAVRNDLTVASSATVGLKVRITEMTRQVTRALGVDWSALGTIGKYTVGFQTANAVASTISSAYAAKGLSVDTIIEALASDNLVRVLAEPTLTARSGESASFLVGGEYPIPVAQGGSNSNAITITYQQYGVSLSFVPTVLSSGRISLHVRPEVSELATSPAQGAVTLSQGSGSLQIPALTVRRAETTLELGSGQSFAIAGLLQDSTTQANNYLPGLGDVPILGALFRSDSFQHNQTELVIIVTPYIVGSASDPDALQDSGAGYTPPNDIERVLLLRQRGLTQASNVSVPGDAGFIVR